MISSFHIENFRGIKKINLETPKITVLTGANNSGKSSIIYAMLVLKNIINNPNQSIDNLLTLPFINLGGFKETVFQKDDDLNIKLEIKTQAKDLYGVSIGLKDSFFSWKANFSTQLSKVHMSFPYPLNKYEQFRTRDLNYTGVIDFSWNGFDMKDIIHRGKTHERGYEEKYLQTLFSKVVQSIQNIDFIPIRRGFTKAYFNPVPLQTQISNEDEIATLISLDRDLQGKITHYLEKIVDRVFFVYNLPNIASFHLQTRNKKTAFTADLVNEGLGTNQLVTILAKALQKNNAFICIDEPEIHLHPSLITRLVEVLVDIAQKEGKQFVVSTHSEHFIMGLLKEVVKENIQHDEIAVYHLTTDKDGTNIERQAINDKGQIEGGLVHFIASEIDDLATLFKL